MRLGDKQMKMRALAAVIALSIIAVVGCGGGGNGQIGPPPAPVVSLSPASLSFGSQTVGTTSPSQSVTLTNIGNAGLTITGITPTGDFAQTDNCGSSVAALSSCTITVTFKPTQSGARTGAVSISDNAAGSPQSVSLTGTGVVSAPAVTLSSSSLNFGNQTLGTTSPPQSVTVTNSGNAELTISGVSASGDFAQTNTCSAPVAAGASCSINVTFTPTLIGTRTGAVSISDNAAGSPQTISLTGTGASVSGITNVKYWIVIYKENRSFGHYFGWYPNVEGGTTTVVHNNGQTSTAFHLPDSGHFDAPHGYTAQHRAVNGGAMNDFDLAEGPFGTSGAGFESLSQYTRIDLPVYARLADTYLLWDNLFPSVMSESWPNHLYTVAASSGPPSNVIINNTANAQNFSWGFDSNSPTGGQCLNSAQQIVNCSPGVNIPDVVSELNAAGRLTQLWGAAFNTRGYYWVAANGIQNLCGLSTVGSTPCPMNGAGGSFWHPLAGSSDPQTLVSAIAAENGTHNSIGEVLIVTPQTAGSEHPVYGVCAGEDWTRQIIQAVFNNPAVYNHAVIFVAWDDYGGFYDPVPPTFLDNFGLGVRVPGLIISPFTDTTTWSNHIYHGSSQAGFEATLKLIETWASAMGTPIAPLTSRDATAIDISNAFNFNQSAISPPAMPVRPCGVESTPLAQNPASTYYFDWPNPVAPGSTSSPQTMTLTNESPHPIVMGTLSTEMYAAIVNDLCSGQTLAPTQSCTFGAEFAPPLGAPQGNAWGLIHAPYTCPLCLDPPAAYGLAPGHSPVDTGLEGVVGP